MVFRHSSSNSSLQELSDETILQDRLAVLQRAYAPVFVDLGVIDSGGTQVAYAGPFRLGRADYSEAGWFEQALQREYFISDVFPGLRGLPHFIIAVRRTGDGEPWILRATVDFVAFNNLVENIRYSATHARGKIAARLTQNGDHSACHVFAPMVADAFDDRGDTAVAHGKPLTGDAVYKDFPGRGSVEQCVARNDILVSHKG